MGMKRAKPTYQVCCAVCYSCVLLTTKNRKDANRAATSHLTAYGHQVYINAQVDPKDPEREAR